MTSTRIGLRPLRLPRGELDRLEDRSRLADALVVLALGLCVDDGPAARLNVDLSVLDHHCADVDGGVEVAGEAQIADRSTVGAALMRLELVDDLHRTDLRRPGER